MNIGISYGVHILKSFIDLNSKNTIDCQEWRLGMLLVGAWNFGNCKVFLVTFLFINEMRLSP
jgi:hypothetical protein